MMMLTTVEMIMATTTTHTVILFNFFCYILHFGMIMFIHFGFCSLERCFISLFYRL